MSFGLGRLSNSDTTVTQRLHNVYTTFGVALRQDTTQVSRHNARIKSDTTQGNKCGRRAANPALPRQVVVKRAPYFPHPWIEHAKECEILAEKAPLGTPVHTAGGFSVV